jgi:outer membrane protein assembly factor BamD (BamD/ComL family)
MARDAATTGPALAAFALLATLSAAGCQGIAEGPLSRWRAAYDHTLAKPITEKEVGDDRSLMKRWLSPRTPPSHTEADPAGMVKGRDGWKPAVVENDPKAEAEFKAAEELFQRGEYAKAQPLFVAMARARKGTPWGEKAQYYLAETKYQRADYVGAHNEYETLVITYPGTDYLDALVKREYAIGNYWLSTNDAEAFKAMPYNSRMTGRIPFIDVNGHAVAALEHVRHHDPTGPLSDKALLRIADHYKASGEYELAAIHYDQLVTDHAKSDLVQKAQHESIDSKVKGYYGPEYDATGLEQARATIRQTRVAFPEKIGETSELSQTLDLINDQRAERDFRTAKFYRRTGHPTSAEWYFNKVVKLWPDSNWAEKSKTELVSLAKIPRKDTLPSKIMTLPGSTDPLTGGVGGGGLTGGMNSPNGGASSY